jgi:hypothetical protein
VLYLHPVTEEGFIVEHNTQAFYKGLSRLVGVYFKFKQGASKVQAEYQQHHPTMTSRAFWERYLQQ